MQRVRGSWFLIPCVILSAAAASSVSKLLHAWQFCEANSDVDSFLLVLAREDGGGHRREIRPKRKRLRADLTQLKRPERRVLTKRRMANV